MNEAAASLDRLHDIVMPPVVPWWPLAPGWYVLGVLLLATILFIGLRAWLRWRRNAWRREALRALDSAGDVASIGALLRRAALASHPREEVAPLHADAWADWLSARSPEPLTPDLRRQLTTGVYAVNTTLDLKKLRVWTARWIAASPVS